MEKLTLEKTAVKVSVVKTEAGVSMKRYEYDGFASLEKAFVENFDALRAQGFSTKVVGFVLLVMKYDREGVRK